MDTSPLLTLSETCSFTPMRAHAGCLWQKIKKYKLFQCFFQTVVGLGTTIGFVALILPASIALGVISSLFFAIFSPFILCARGKRGWQVVKNKLYSLLSDLIVLPKVVLLTPLSFSPNVSVTADTQEERLVVFVHGFLHNKSCWNTLSKRLQNETQKNESPITKKDIYSINLGTPLTMDSIATQACFLATKLNQIRTHRKLDKLKVILDCHSMGGLVAAYFALHYAKQVNVKILRLIANGTPWHGTKMANIGSCFQSAKEMVPDHSIQKTIREKLTNSKLKDKLSTIASTGDLIVPLASAQGRNLPIHESNRYLLYKPLGHLALLEEKLAQNYSIRLISQTWNDNDPELIKNIKKKKTDVDTHQK